VTVETANGGSGAESIGVSCAAGQRALGGGTSTTDTSPGDGLLASVPLEQYSTDNPAEDGETPTGWYAEWDDISFGTSVTVFAICTA
jgi:hypothetical protein